MQPAEKKFAWFWVAASIVLVSCAQLLLKLGALALAELPITAHNISLAQMASWWPLGVGVLCYAVSMYSWLRALEVLPLNTTYPALGLSYPLVYLGAAMLPSLHENISMVRLVGIGLVIIAIALLTPSRVTGSST